MQQDYVGLLIQAPGAGSAINSTVDIELVLPLKGSDHVSSTDPGTRDISAKLQVPQRLSRSPQGRRSPSKSKAQSSALPATLPCPSAPYRRARARLTHLQSIYMT